MLSLVIPVYRNEESLPDLLDAVQDLSDQLGGAMEVVFVVDGVGVVGSVREDPES